MDSRFDSVKGCYIDKLSFVGWIDRFGKVKCQQDDKHGWVGKIRSVRYR